MDFSFIGKLLKPVRAGETKLLKSLLAAAPKPKINLTSPQFADRATMPAGNEIPELNWSGAPQETEEFVLILEDPDAPMATPFVHWVAYAIDPSIRTSKKLTPENFGKNHTGSRSYRGPGPVPGHGPHNYVFQIFALDKKINWPKPPKKSEVFEAIQGHVLAIGELRGIYER